jgi:hypothetical protein
MMEVMMRVQTMTKKCWICLVLLLRKERSILMFLSPKNLLRRSQLNQKKIQRKKRRRMQSQAKLRLVLERTRKKTRLRKLTTKRKILKRRESGMMKMRKKESPSKMNLTNTIVMRIMTQKKLWVRVRKRPGLLKKMKKNLLLLLSRFPRKI